MIIIDLNRIHTEILYNPKDPTIVNLLKTSDSSYEQIWRDGDNREPTHRIIYPAEVGVVHCPICLEKTILQHSIENLVLHDFGHINLDKENVDNWEDGVEVLYWGHFGDVGLCYECMGIPQDERPID